MTQPRNSLFTTAALLVLAVVLPLGAAGRGKDAPKAADPLAFLPKDCVAVISIQAADLLASDYWKELTKEFPEANQGFDEMEGLLGLARDNIGRIILGVPDVDPKAKWNERPGPVIIISTVKAVSADGIKALQKQKLKKGGKLKEYRAVKAGKYTLYEGPSTKFTFDKEKPSEEQVYDGRGESFCIVADRLVIYGQARDLKPVLERDKKPELSKELQTALKEVDLSRTAAFAAAMPNHSLLENLGADLDKLAKLMVRANGHCAVGKTIKASLTVVCKDDKSANDLRKILDGARVMVKQQDLPKEVKEVVKILDAIKLKNTSTKVMGELEVKSSDAIKAFKILGTFLRGPNWNFFGPFEHWAR